MGRVIEPGAGSTELTGDNLTCGILQGKIGRVGKAVGFRQGCAEEYGLCHAVDTGAFIYCEFDY
jgi:hypothetical protein